MKPRSSFLVCLSTAFLFSQTARGNPQFLESEQPFIRSALVISENPENRVRRGVLLRLGENLWTCFEPDLLRYAAIWKAPANAPPLTLDSMAAVSYPDKNAKADESPALNGKIIASTPELPGVGLTMLPKTDIRKGSLIDKKTKVGPLPADDFRWQGIGLHEENVVLNYRIGNRQIRETTRALSANLIERLVSVGPGNGKIAIHIDASSGEITGSDPRRSVVLESGDFPHLHIAGNGGFETRSDTTRGVSLEISPNRESSLFRILRSSTPVTKQPPFDGFPENNPSIPIFPEKIEARSPAPEQTRSPITTRTITLPQTNPWNRTIRPTDIAFLSNGDALIATLDGDVWRVTDIEKETATWSRAAFGIFEPMSIATNPKDEVFVLGRDQITKLEDINQDGFFDHYISASDAFRQTLHTRDYATSMELLPDGSFVIARAGLAEGADKRHNENADDRGSVLKISPDGTKVSKLADGLRVPFVGLRTDGTVFSSDQQGNWIPSSPVHMIAGGIPYLGYAPSDFRKQKKPIAPLLWFPYQINRSGASFATLPGESFPSIGERFVHLSWSGRMFAIETPENGFPFAWKLPAEFDFPILGAATQPTTGKFFATGIGISGYKPTTPRDIGLAEISENSPVAAPTSLELSQERITIGFRQPLPPGLSLITPRPELDLWNIRRSQKYGSGHFRWDGEPGEHSIPVGQLSVSEDRKTVSIAVPGVFRSDILRLRLHFTDTVAGNAPYEIEIYSRPSDLSAASPADLAAVSEREKSSAVALVPGDAKRGSELFKNYGCVGCHSLDGTKLTGPPLNGIASRHPDDLESFLKTSILEPTAVITEGYEASMPAFAGVIPDQDLEHLVDYLKSLK